MGEMAVLSMAAKELVMVEMVALDSTWPYGWAKRAFYFLFVSYLEHCVYDAACPVHHPYVIPPLSFKKLIETG
ncbi:hypothetical protein KSF_024740 [Reticulibacter mediterranei]|uniref:Uncharacterized protein n=1 Tax=Reticulibacter mediterranei TaxID=2778369 RepID=A0A8J3IDQ0_9CHLR|nr:hypothetical protein KSF_024740 [Reticulibacter mediterranei]